MPSEVNPEKIDAGWEGVTLARVVRAHGIRGEVACEILTDFPERLLRLQEVWLWNGSAPPKRVGVVRCRLTGGRRRQALFQFEGVATREDAERLRGWEVQAPIGERVALAAGLYYVTDLIGCDVVEVTDKGVGACRGTPVQSSAGDEGAAKRLGVIRDVQIPGERTRGTPVLVVETARGELLIPLAEEICTRIDVGARRIEVRLPEGLKDLNR